MTQQKNGILLGWGTLITAATALAISVATFTSVKALAGHNRERIIIIENSRKEDTKLLHRIDKRQAVMATRMGVLIDPND